MPRGGERLPGCWENSFLNAPSGRARESQEMGTRHGCQPVPSSWSNGALVQVLGWRPGPSAHKLVTSVKSWNEQALVPASVRWG